MTDLEVSRLSTSDKIAETMRRSIPHLPEEVGSVVKSLCSAKSVAIIAGTIASIGVAHFFGIGEFLDLILVFVGGIFLGSSIFEAAAALQNFVKISLTAQTEAELDKGGEFFARAVTI